MRRGGVYAGILAVFLNVMWLLPAACGQTVINDLVVVGEANCSSAMGLPKTGQQKCYDQAGSEISCSGSGCDAEYADPAGGYDYGYTRGAGTWANWNADGQRFKNNGDGTITDRATNLMWVADPTAAGRGGTYNWTNAINASENLTYATYSDWRLPNVKELGSIVGYNGNSPAINTAFFTSQSTYYWSSTTSGAAPLWAWLIDFSYGYVDPHDKTTMSYIRPVRGSQ